MRSGLLTVAELVADTTARAASPQVLTSGAVRPVTAVCVGEASAAREE
jgi:hypothetical protein